MRKFLFTLIAVVAAMQLSAAPVDQAVAFKKAQACLKGESGTLRASSASSLKLHRAVMGDAKLNQPVFYVFNSSNSFVIVSGDDRAEEILAVGDGPIDLDNIPDNMRVWLNSYKKQIEYLQAHPGLVVEVPSKMMAPRRAQNVSPLLTAKWDQQAPFWNQCVINGTQCLTGCPATSLAQVFHYWKYPTGETGPVPSYRFRESYWSAYTTVPALPSTTFDWANMKNSYLLSSTSAQKAAVATLMRYLGQAEHMNYGADGSGISSDSTVLIANACKFFGYDSNVRAVKKTGYSGYPVYYNDSQWATMIQNELAAGRPIVYCAISDEGSGGGHAFNIDGYTVSSNKYHINWGWSGAGNGDFALNSFVDYEGWTFDLYQQMVIGIQPPGGEVTFPVLEIDTESMDFGTIDYGTSASQTFTVSARNLLGEVTFKSSNSSYTFSPASLTAEEAMAGATVTVTYTPIAAGTHTGTLTISSAGAENQTIAVTGTAVNRPIITSDQYDINISAPAGGTATTTFTVTGKNLTTTLYLSVVQGNDVFRINKANVTKTAAAKGVEVTLTYSPQTPGMTDGTVMLRSAGADTVYVALHGTATFETSAPVMQAPDAQYVTQTSFRADWTDATVASGVRSYTLEYATDGNSQSVAGITNKYYTLENLIAGATYTYKVKAFYVDGTESVWSNIQQVTLLESGPTYELGDVNGDGSVSIADVTVLIDFLLGGGSGINEQAADVDQDGGVKIADVTSLIDLLLRGNM